MSSAAYKPGRHSLKNTLKDKLKDRFKPNRLSANKKDAGTGRRSDDRFARPNRDERPASFDQDAKRGQARYDSADHGDRSFHDGGKRPFKKFHDHKDGHRDGRGDERGGWRDRREHADRSDRFDRSGHFDRQDRQDRRDWHNRDNREDGGFAGRREHRDRFDHDRFGGRDRKFAKEDGGRRDDRRSHFDHDRSGFEHAGRSFDRREDRREDRADRFDRSDRRDRFDRSDRRDRFDRSDRHDRFEHSDRPERQDRFDRSDRAGKFDRPRRFEDRDGFAGKPGDRDFGDRRPREDRSFEKRSFGDRPFRDRPFERKDRFDRRDRRDRFGESGRERAWDKGDREDRRESRFQDHASRSFDRSSDRSSDRFDRFDRSDRPDRSDRRQDRFADRPGKFQRADEQRDPGLEDNQTRQEGFDSQESRRESTYALARRPDNAGTTGFGDDQEERGSRERSFGKFSRNRDRDSRDRFGDRPRDRFRDKFKGKFQDKFRDKSYGKPWDKAADRSGDKFADKEAERSADREVSDFAKLFPPRDMGSVLYDVLILGAGAAGLMCAAHLATLGLSVCLVDRSRTPGRKLSIAGGGKANVTNTSLEARHYVCQEAGFVEPVLARVGTDAILNLVRVLGLECEEKEKGKLFLTSEGTALVDALIKRCAAGRVTLLLNERIELERLRLDYTAKDADPSAEPEVRLSTSKGLCRARHLVLALGSPACPATGSTGFGYALSQHLGHTLVPPRAALAPLFLEPESPFLGLSGVSLPVKLSTDKGTVSDDLLFTHVGISGPAVLKMSLYWQEGEDLDVDLLPRVMKPLFEDQDGDNAQGRRTVRSLLSDLLPQRLVDIVIPDYLANRRVAELDRATRDELENKVHALTLKPQGVAGLRQAEVCLGGVSCAEIEPVTFMSKLHPDLSIIGEMLDVTGHLGGYNLHWAFASGLLAAEAIADKLYPGRKKAAKTATSRADED